MNTNSLRAVTQKLRFGLAANEGASQTYRSARTLTRRFPRRRKAQRGAAYECGHCIADKELWHDGLTWRLSVAHDPTCPVYLGNVSRVPQMLDALARVEGL